MIYRVLELDDEPVALPWMPVDDSLTDVMKYVTSGNRLAARSAIEKLECEMLKLEQVEQPLEHFFCNGLYGRKRFNPKGSLIVTMLHGEENLSFVLSGKLGVITEDGYHTLEGGQMFVTKPGTKRVIYAQEDTYFATVHPNPENVQDTEYLEARITCRSFSEYTLREGL